MDVLAGDLERVVGRALEAVGLDQLLRLHHPTPAVGRPAGDTHDPVGLIVGLDRPAEILVDPHPLLDHVEAMFKVVEHLAFRRQV